jgi:hypothetical protein
MNCLRKGQTGPVQTARKTDGSGHNSKKDRWVRSQLEERHMGPVQTAGMTVRAGSVPLSDVPWPYLSSWAGDDDEAREKQDGQTRLEYHSTDACFRGREDGRQATAATRSAECLAQQATASEDCDAKEEGHA